MPKTTKCACGRTFKSAGLVHHERRCEDARVHSALFRAALHSRDWSEYELAYPDRFAALNISEEERQGSRVLPGFDSYALRTGARTETELYAARKAAERVA